MTPNQDAGVVRRLQNSPLTRWLWRMYQHDETGRVVIMPLLRHPGRRWRPVAWRE
jgi:hypothetical protein